LTPCSQLNEVALDFISRVLARLVLPDAENGPSLVAQAPVGIPVPADVPGKFGRPEEGVRFRESCVFGAGVPKTAVDEDDKAFTWEDDIRLPSAVKAKRTLDAEPESAPVELRSERKFWCRPGATSPPHSFADPCR
jgi:hypothetical protein